jgi:hypothetical protein
MKFGNMDEIDNTKISNDKEKRTMWIKCEFKGEDTRKNSGDTLLSS